MKVGTVASVFEPYFNEPLFPNNEGIRGENQAGADETKCSVFEFDRVNSER